MFVCALGERVATIALGMVSGCVGQTVPGHADGVHGSVLVVCIADP